MSVPVWVQDAVFYQIFPDRFANGDPANDPPAVQPWGSPPTITGFQGGDLRGIVEHFDYLTDLGVTALYLNPIFAAGSNHRYNTSDYHAIDDRLGTLGDFTRLIEQAHARGLRVVLDGVFNHTGRAFFAFRDLLDHGEASAYRDWYHPRQFPLDSFGDGPAERYLAWWNFRSLPKLNTAHAPVRKYLLETARLWIERGADGWRLDVPNEIDDDSFWAEFRHTVKQANPDAYLLGEIWTVDPRWVGPRTFDGLMNYPLRKSLLDLVVDGSLTPSAFRLGLEGQIGAYPEANVLAQYNLLGSHDTERVATLAHQDARRLRLLSCLQFLLPGAPGIYYGDEIGLTGGKDPASRGAFPWDPAAWDTSRRDLLRRLIQLRKTRPEIRRGRLEFLVAFARRWEDQTAVCVVSLSEATQEVRLPVGGLGWRPGREVRDGLSGREVGVGPEGLALALGPLEAVLLVG
ncbi:MAG: alpha amylase catalytic region [Anaerolineales bacterium]|nr:alpha amylase catalytic region [Anaerolineales bacterium]